MLTDPWTIKLKAREMYKEAGLDWLTRTTEKLIKFRKWDATVEEVKPIIQEAGVFFIPAGVLWVPAYGFPINEPTCCMSLLHVRYVRPVGSSDMKCQTLGHSSQLIGPAWFGMDETTRGKIIEQKAVLLVEGPMDVLACRVILGQSIPVLSGLGRKLSRNHEIDLNLLGVQTVYSMWDQDTAGRTAQIPKGIQKRVRLRCPAKDPSECLKSLATAKQLYNEVQMAHPHSFPNPAPRLPGPMASHEK